MKIDAKKVILGILIVLLIIVGLSRYSNFTASNKEKAIKEAIASIVTERLSKGVLSVKEVTEILYTQVQGNSYVGSLKVTFINKSGQPAVLPAANYLTLQDGQEYTVSSNFTMICDGKSVQVALE